MFHTDGLGTSAMDRFCSSGAGTEVGTGWKLCSRDRGATNTSNDGDWVVCHTSSNTSANSCTLTKRACGSLARAPKTASSTAGGREGTRSHKLEGVLYKCWLYT